MSFNEERPFELLEFNDTMETFLSNSCSPSYTFLAQPKAAFLSFEESETPLYMLFLAALKTDFLPMLVLLRFTMNELFIIAGVYGSLYLWGTLAYAQLSQPPVT